MGCKQAYFGYNNNSYWLIEAEEIDKDNYYVTDKYGYHIIEFRKDGLGYLWVPSLGESDIDNPHYNLLYAAWDEFMSGEGEPLSKEVEKIIQGNVAITDTIHDEFHKTMPVSKTWTNKNRKKLEYPWAES
jgi:hypothetical protein